MRMNFMQRFSQFAGSMLTTGAIALAAGGCNQGTMASQESDFQPDDGARQVWQIADAQAAAGARDDATLYQRHFDGAALSSLGRSKLDSMMNADVPPTAIYLDLNARDPSA